MDTDAPDLFSVIVPTYNRAHCLGRAIRSVLAQTHSNLELIIADDASTHETTSLVESIDDPRLVYVRQELNMGPCAARNLGLAAARGPLIAFKDSDDERVLDKLEYRLDALERSGTQYGATFGDELIYGLDHRYRYGPGQVRVAPSAARPAESGVLTHQRLGRHRAAASCLRRSIALSPLKLKPWAAWALASAASVLSRDSATLEEGLET